MADASHDSWDSFRHSFAAFETALGRSRAILVNSASLRSDAKAVVQAYFRRARPHLIELHFSPDELSGLDGEMQSLLRLSNGRNRKRSYVALLKRVRGHLQTIEAAREVRLGEAPDALGAVGQVKLSTVEHGIIDTLNRSIPSAANSYRQAVIDLNSTDRVSFRGTANELRESLREVLDHLAPDQEVRSAEGFKLEPGRDKPTQRQKVRHILRARRLPKTATKVPEEAVRLVDELTSSITRSIYDRSSLAAHAASSKQEVRQMKMYVDSVLAELLEIHK